MKKITAFLCLLGAVVMTVFVMIQLVLGNYFWATVDTMIATFNLFAAINLMLHETH